MRENFWTPDLEENFIGLPLNNVWFLCLLHILSDTVRIECLGLAKKGAFLGKIGASS